MPAQDRWGGAHYRIVLQGQLDPSWQAVFDGLEVRWDAHQNTVVEGFVTDQAALHGFLARVRDLGVPLLSVCRAPL